MDFTDLGPAMTASAAHDAQKKADTLEQRVKVLEQIVSNLHYQLTGTHLDAVIAAPARPTGPQEAERANYYSALVRRPPQKLGV